MNLYTIATGVPFLDAIAANWLRESGDDPQTLARGLILLPTRRAARALAEAFLRTGGGRPLLLPRIGALGALDEALLALSGVLDLPPAVEPAQRLAVLTAMILARKGADGAPDTADRAWPLAAELAALMDEAEQNEVDLARGLPDAADPAFAEHWQHTLRFLHIVTAAWPAWLAEQGLMNPAERRVRLLEAQADAWSVSTPRDRVLIAGTTGGIPPVARLLKVAARLPAGAVVLPGLDLDLPDAAWDALDDQHPQAGMRRLLNEMGAARGDVRAWPMETRPVSASRVRLLRDALLPAAALDWNATRPPPARREGQTMGQLALALPETPQRAPFPPGALPFRLAAADQQQEAAAIAMILRDALETPGRRAALVTPDRDLARRVMAELLRFGVVADDSAGESLAETPPAVFLRLLARAVAEDLAPVPLLALLKHPLAAAGLSPAACRDGARVLEVLCLRGQRPLPGLTGLRRALEDASRRPGYARALDLLGRIEACLAPILRVAPAATAPRLVLRLDEALSALLEAAEALAATSETPGPVRLWAAEEGEALATHLVPVLEALAILPEQPRATLPGLLDATLEGAVVRSRRALRGKGGEEHPRVFIWGLLEARLQSVDVLVLGGLAEGVWPQAADPGPWMSRLMRSRLGLPSPEERVGQAAHDFAASACAAPVVVLSCPLRRDGAPTVPARWLERLRAYLAGRQQVLPVHPAASWVSALDVPCGGPRPVRPPKPCPSVALRPRRLSVTEVETWLRDPYAIYAKHVLKLVPLDPIDQDVDNSDYGTAVHAGLHRFLREHGAAWPSRAAERLRECLDHVLSAEHLRPAVVAWWRPRLRRIADWVAAHETERRAGCGPAAIASEIGGVWDIVRPGGAFTLRSKADRFERDGEGRLTVIDYKTGQVPSPTDVSSGFAPQLLLEAAMAAAGAFGAEWKRNPAALEYWQLQGGFTPGKLVPLFKAKAEAVQEAVSAAEESFLALIDRYDDPTRPYLAQPNPLRAPKYPAYSQLARVAEWGAGEDE